MKRNKISKTKLGIVLGLFAVVILLSSSIYVYQDDKDDFQIRMSSAIAEYALAAGESGWLEIYLYPHAANPAATYAENTSATLEAASLAYFDSDGWSTSTFDTEVSFDIVIRTRHNKSDVWKTDKFIDARTRVNLTVAAHTGVADWAVGADFSDSAMTGVISRNNTAEDYIWQNWYLNNGGNGYQLADDGQLDFSAPVIWAKR